MSWSLLNLVAQADIQRLLFRLVDDGYAVRTIDGSGVTDGPALWARAGAALGFEGVQGWDSFEDRVWQALFMSEDDEERYAIVWEHADAMLDGGLGDLLTAADALQSVGRQAYEEDVHILTFLVGDGPNFPPLA